MISNIGKSEKELVISMW